MTDEGACISQSELKQAAKSHCLTVRQCQWDISERGRFLYDLKPNVYLTSNFDFPTRQIYRQIAQLKTGFSKLNDYLHKIGVSESKKCKCGGSETIEHYLLHCELYFNEREAMRSTLFKQVGITELTIDLLLRCNNSDFKKEYGMKITLALGDFDTVDFITQTSRF